MVKYSEEIKDNEHIYNELQGLYSKKMILTDI